MRLTSILLISLTFVTASIIKASYADDYAKCIDSVDINKTLFTNPGLANLAHSCITLYQPSLKDAERRKAIVIIPNELKLSVGDTLRISKRKKRYNTKVGGAWISNLRSKGIISYNIDEVVPTVEKSSVKVSCGSKIYNDWMEKTQNINHYLINMHERNNFIVKIHSLSYHPNPANYPDNIEECIVISLDYVTLLSSSNGQALPIFKFSDFDHFK